MGMRDQGRSGSFVILVWGVTALLLAASVVAGNVVLSGADERLLSVLLAFAGGAVLFATATGFFVSFMIENA